MPAENTFPLVGPNQSDPMVHAAALTPDDESDLPIVTRGIYVGTSGDVAVVLLGGETVTFKDLAAGIVHQIRISRLLETGTDAIDIVGLW